MNSYHWSQLSPGLQHSFEVELTGAMIRSFLRLSGDNNPLHTSKTFAAQAGFRDVVAHGMLTASLYSRLVGVYLPGRYCLLHGIDVEFVGPVFSGDRLLVQGEIFHLNEAYRRIEVKASITNGGNELVSRAKIRVGLHEY
jgi:3-hydroxybutyryl-CoA dehydratase